MTDPARIPEWTALFLGLFALFAGVGELRNHGRWCKMLEEIAASPALQMVTAMVELLVGASVYFINPWASQDLLGQMMNLLGTIMCVEALVIVAFSDLYLAFWVRRLGHVSMAWAWISVLFGMALIVAAQPVLMDM